MLNLPACFLPLVIVLTVGWCVPIVLTRSALYAFVGALHGLIPGGWTACCAPPLVLHHGAMAPASLAFAARASGDRCRLRSLTAYPKHIPQLDGSLSVFHAYMIGCDTHRVPRGKVIGSKLRDGDERSPRNELEVFIAKMESHDVDSTFEV